jgi:hypothetical protein
MVGNLTSNLKMQNICKLDFLNSTTVIQFFAALTLLNSINLNSSSKSKAKPSAQRCTVVESKKEAR